MEMLFFYVLAAVVFGWLIFDCRSTRVEQYARALDRGFKSPKAKEASKPIPMGYVLHERYSQWQKEAEAMEFRSLGVVYTESNLEGNIQPHLTMVMVNPEGNSLLAFNRSERDNQVLEQTEMESWTEGDEFWYTTDHRIIQQLRSPEAIHVNGCAEKGIAAVMASHKAFISGLDGARFKKYESLDDVLRTTHLQGELRDALARSKEFPIEEEEAVRMNSPAQADFIRKGYAKFREIRKKEKA